MSKDSKIEILLKKSEEFLKKQSYDEGHDLDHHQRVWKNAQELMIYLDLPIDKKALKIACFWHDVMVKKSNDKKLVKNQTADYLDKLMRKSGFERDFINKVVVAVREHSFDDKPSTIEGQVLYDADKLEYLNVKRWKKIFLGLKRGTFSEIKLFLYKKLAKRRLYNLRNKYFFQHTKELHDQKIKELLKNKEAQGIAINLNVNLEKALGV